MRFKFQPAWSNHMRWPLVLIALSALAAAVWYLSSADLGVRTLLHSSAAAAAFLYLGSHVLRALRVGVFLMFERPGTAKLFSIHFVTAWLSAVIPFKLGEIARALGLTILARQPGSGLAAYLMEKLLDAVVLLGAIAFLAAAGGLESSSGLLAAVLLIALLLGAAAYVSARASLRELRTLLVERSTSDRGLTVLLFLRFLESAHGALRKMLHGRFLLLLAMTATIWALDFAAFMSAAAAVGVPVSVPGDFLGTLQSILGGSNLPASGYYAQLVGLCLALASLPAVAALLRMSLVADAPVLRFHQNGLHKHYVSEVTHAPDR